MCKLKILFAQFLAIFCLSGQAAPLIWQHLAPGLDYTKLNITPSLSGKGLHAFRIDLRHYRLQLAFTKQKPFGLVTTRELAIKHHALIAVNGGFFTPGYQSLGLRINNGKVIYPFKPISWWGVFQIRRGWASIVSARNYRYHSNIAFAIQGGPRLLINGRIPRLKPGVAERTAVCITRSGRVIIIVTHLTPLSTTELAHLLRINARKGGFGCVNALNLDGGSSTRVYANVNGFTLDEHSFFPVADVILVVPK